MKEEDTDIENQLVSLSDLRTIPGIGDKTIQRIKNEIIFKNMFYESKYDPSIALDLNHIYKGDCLDLLNGVKDKSIDLILCDLPYGTTKNEWDKIIPFNKLWMQYERIIKDNGVIALYSQSPFDKSLALSNMNLFRYEWIWEKTSATGFLNANKMPMKAHENILIFYKNLPTYNPQKTDGHERKVSKAIHKTNCVETTNYGKHGLCSYDSTERFPRSVLRFATDKQREAIHPTQKPIALSEYLVKTYTDEDKHCVVLDNCAGSMTTAVACDNTGRDWICMEIEDRFCELGLERVNKNRNRLNMENSELRGF